MVLAAVLLQAAHAQTWLTKPCLTSAGRRAPQSLRGAHERPFCCPTREAISIFRSQHPDPGACDSAARSSLRTAAAGAVSSISFGPTSVAGASGLRSPPKEAVRHATHNQLARTLSEVVLFMLQGHIADEVGPCVWHFAADRQAAGTLGLARTTQQTQKDSQTKSAAECIASTNRQNTSEQMTRDMFYQKTEAKRTFGISMMVAACITQRWYFSSYETFDAASVKIGNRAEPQNKRKSLTTSQTWTQPLCRRPAPGKSWRHPGHA